MPSGGNHGGGRPKLPPERKKVTVAVCLNPVLVYTLQSIMKKRGISFSALVEQILINYVEE